MGGAVASIEDVRGLLSSENAATLGQLNTADQSRAVQYAQNFLGNVQQLGGDDRAMEGAQQEFENVLEFTKKAEDMGLNVSQGWTGQQYQQVESAINSDASLKAQFTTRHEAYTNLTQNKEPNVLKVDNADFTNATLDLHFGVYGNQGNADLNEDGNANKTFDQNAAALNLAENGPVDGTVEAANQGGGGGGGDQTQAANGQGGGDQTQAANETGGGDQTQAANETGGDNGAQNASDTGGAGDLLQLLLKLLFNQLDKNHDGKISADEIKSFLQANGVDDATAKTLLKDLIKGAGGEVADGDTSVDDLIKQLASLAPSEGDEGSIDVAKLNEALGKNPDMGKQLSSDLSSMPSGGLTDYLSGQQIG